MKLTLAGFVLLFASFSVACGDNTPLAPTAASGTAAQPSNIVDTVGEVTSTPRKPVCDAMVDRSSVQPAMAKCDGDGASRLEY
jgi:hypothetical protein